MVDNEPTTKRCPKCEQTKPLDGLARSKSQKDGLNAWCRACMSAYAKTRQQAKDAEQKAKDAAACRASRERRSEADREREKEKTRERELRWRERNLAGETPDYGDKPKRCCRCKHHLPRSEFFPSLSRPDALATVCKACGAAIARESRKADPERARAKDAERREREGDKRREVVRRSQTKHKAKYAAQRRARYQRDREWFRQRRKANYEAKPSYREKHRANARRRAIEKPEAVAATKRRWNEDNRELLRPQRVLISHRRRVRLKQQSTDALTLERWEQVLSYYGHACAYCLRPQTELSRRLTVDHIRPVADGGGNESYNLAPACLRCNQMKSARTPLEFLAGIRLNKKSECKQCPRTPSIPARIVL